MITPLSELPHPADCDNETRHEKTEAGQWPGSLRCARCHWYVFVPDDPDAGGLTTNFTGLSASHLDALEARLRRWTRERFDDRDFREAADAIAALRRRGAGTALAGRDNAASLAAIRALRERLDQEEQQLVFRLRLEGQSWQSIADFTGMASRQAAIYRYESAALLDKLAAARGRQPKP